MSFLASLIVGATATYAAIKAQITSGSISALLATRDPTAETITAPALNCFPLETNSVLRSADGQTLASERKIVTQILQATPPRSDLLVEAGFVERKPSELFAMHNQALGRQCPGCEARGAAELDRVYEGRQVSNLQ